jgi:capsule polysaccharide export protein KpsE/RkpR
MQEIKKINVLSVLKISALFGVLMGIVTILYMYFALPGLMAANPVTAQQALDTKTLLTASIGAGVMQFVMLVVVAVLGSLDWRN